MKLARWAVLGLLLLAGAKAQPTSSIPAVKHVVVIGLDGCRPEAVQRAAGPVLRRLWRDGAWTWNAQAVKPSVTQVNFASMLTGTVPEKHGIDRIEWTKGARPKVRVPTIFELVAEKGGKAAGFLGHEKLYPVETAGAQNSNIHFEHSSYEASNVAPRVARLLREQRPDFCFVYFGDLDGAGHRHGWLSPEQLALMPAIDDALGVIVDALGEAQMWSSTLLIVTADHGGHGKSHGTGTIEDTTIPWIAHGPGVPAGEIATTVRIFDTAATAALALGLAMPERWDGRPLFKPKVDVTRR